MAVSLSPGDRIEARCTRCNDVTGHVIVALVGGVIVKVECRACGSVHKYYPPVTQKEGREKKTVCRVKAGSDRKDAVSSIRPAKEKPATSSRAGAGTTAAGLKARKAAEDMEQNWQRTMNRTASSPKPYAMTARFELGDVVDHPSFGQGVVQELLPPDKMQILFRDGVRLLRCLG